MYLEDEVRALRQEIARLAKLIEKREPSPEPVATYVSSGGKVHAITGMATRYIRNVIDLSDYRLNIGVREALEAELRRRGEG